MKVLLLGSGGREHAMARALERAGHELIWAPGNGAQGRWKRHKLSLGDLDSVLQLALQEQPELTLVGPEDPLAAGLVDRLNEAGLKAWGPNARQAQLESSKAWAKEFMARHGLATAAFRVCHNQEQAEQAIDALWTPQGVVVKADGLAAGKGVVVATTRQQAIEAASQLGPTLVVERCLQGPEASLILLLRPDGYQAFPLVRDHKRLLAGDQGPNTGGMGAFFPIPETPSVQGMLESLWKGLVDENLNYFGALFLGLILTEEGPQLLEFNCRLGDPESEVLLEALENDFVEVLQGQPLQMAPGFHIDVVLASAGYPASSTSGLVIEGADQVSDEVTVLHAGTELQPDGTLTTAGGRVLHLVARGQTLEQARQRAGAAAQRIGFGGQPPQWRNDIGASLVART